MSIVPALRCRCNPDFVYASARTFSRHRSSERHKAWELRERVDDLQKRAVRRDNEVLADRTELVYIIRNGTGSMKVGRTGNADARCLRRRYQTAYGTNFRILYWKLRDSKTAEINFGRKFQKMRLSLEVYDSYFFLEYLQHFTKVAGCDPHINFV